MGPAPFIDLDDHLSVRLWSARLYTLGPRVNDTESVAAPALVDIHVREDAACTFGGLAHPLIAASQRSAPSPGTKQYSPPRVIVKREISCSRRRIGCLGIVYIPVPLLLPVSRSFS